jgi:hypothetical protein
LFILTLLLLNVLIFIMDWNLLEHTSNYTLLKLPWSKGHSEMPILSKRHHLYDWNVLLLAIVFFSKVMFWISQLCTLCFSEMHSTWQLGWTYCHPHGNSLDFSIATCRFSCTVDCFTVMKEFVHLNAFHFLFSVDCYMFCII